MIKIAFSGRLRAGKDYVAAKAGLDIMGFADPMYIITEKLFGSSDKSKPGVREMLQYLGQVGWGCVNEKYPVNIERGLFIDLIRREAPKIFRTDPKFCDVDWAEFGLRNDFWVQILLNRNDLDPAVHPNGVGVVNARFFHELEPLEDAGFLHFHVRCSEETRQERLGPAWNPAANADTSEAMASQLDITMPEDAVIWNDHRAMPSNRNYMTVEQFVERVNLKRMGFIGIDQSVVDKVQLA